jgi:hypothetical protein
LQILDLSGSEQWQASVLIRNFAISRSVSDEEVQLDLDLDEVLEVLDLFLKFVNGNLLVFNDAHNLEKNKNKLDHFIL